MVELAQGNCSAIKYYQTSPLGLFLISLHVKSHHNMTGKSSCLEISNQYTFKVSEPDQTIPELIFHSLSVLWGNNNNWNVEEKTSFESFRKL